MSPKTGFKPCEDSHWTMSVTDPHRVCLWCLERDHDPKSCSECPARHPKALRERSLKLMAARHSTPCRSRSRSRGRSRDRSWSHHSSSSKSLGQSKKKQSKKSHCSPTSPHRSASATLDECPRTRPPSLEPASGSTPRFPEFPGAGATPPLPSPPPN
ncbi:hypothetical protein NDU88_004993 [Pleurodeles waltl]|uniref:Uncharacterized protein n=1 Tax=Pleurodeles waltl TaxID=8319 RepID=A0AAV7T969_PLEWA|nr:hypothetical protein NDU88_004993 [Pleurodeles waltl]